VPDCGRVLQLADRFGFDLPNAFAGHLEDASDFFEGVGVTVAETVAQFDDLALANTSRSLRRFDLVLEHLVRGGVDGGFDASSSMKSPK